MAKVLDAILKINPNAEVTVNGNDVDNIIWHNGTEVISKSDIQTKQTELQQEEQDAKTEKANNRASGKAKLKAGEALTDAEISALFGD